MQRRTKRGDNRLETDCLYRGLKCDRGLRDLIQKMTRLPLKVRPPRREHSGVACWSLGTGPVFIASDSPSRHHHRGVLQGVDGV